MTDDALAWMQFFAAIRGIGFHPRNPPQNRRSVDEDAREADAMLNEYKARFSCPSPSTNFVPSGQTATASRKRSGMSSSPTPAA